jgi:membrane-bound serine protease (ClpP class)
MKRRTAFGKPWRLGIGWLLLLAGTWGAVHGEGPVAEEGRAPVYMVDIKSTINPGALGLLEHAIKTAETNQAALLIVRINTPGGLLTTTRDMVGRIAESRVPVVGYVGPSGANAGSAGAFILLATHVAVMESGTNIGASTPVTDEGRDIEGAMGKKVMNDTRAFMRGIAGSHKRNADVAESFVSEARSLTAEEAKQQNVIDLVTGDFSALLPALAGREIEFHGEKRVLNFGDSEIKQVEPRLVDKILSYIAHPQIAHLLISLGSLAIFIEIISPGLAFPGILGAIAVILGLVAVQTLPVNMGFLMLLFLGLGLMLAEYFVAGFGMLGVGGAIAFMLGSLKLFDSSISEQFEGAIMSVSVAVSAAMLVTSILLTRMLTADPNRISARVEGKTGEAMVNFAGEGHVLVAGRRWPAVTQEPLRHGDRIVVVQQDKSGRLTVKKAES